MSGSSSLLAIFARVDRRADGCWIWMGARRNKYGAVGVGGRKTTYVHRVVFELANNAKLGDRQLVMHRCDVPLCVNPDHLSAGDWRANALDSVQKGRHIAASKTHCKRGHPLSGDNMRFQVKTGGRVARICRTCQRMHRRDHKRRKRWKQT